MSIEEVLEHWVAQAREQLQRLPYALNLPFTPEPEPVEVPRPADGWLSGRFEDVPRFVWLAVWPLALSLLALWFYLTAENDQPIRYRVPSPKTPEREEILSNPSVKVRTAFCRNVETNTQFYSASLTRRAISGPRNERGPMLRASDRPVPRLHQHCHPRRHRSRRRRCRGRAEDMGRNELPRAAQGLALHATTRAG